MRLVQAFQMWISVSSFDRNVGEMVAAILSEIYNLRAQLYDTRIMQRTKRSMRVCFRNANVPMPIRNPLSLEWTQIFLTLRCGHNKKKCCLFFVLLLRLCCVPGRKGHCERHIPPLFCFDLNARGLGAHFYNDIPATAECQRILLCN